MKKPFRPIGMRNIKTAIAIMLCVSFTKLFAFISRNAYMGTFNPIFNLIFVRSEPLYSSIAALAAMGNTMNESYKAALSRVLGTFIGGIFAVIHIYLAELFNSEIIFFFLLFIFIILIILISSTFFSSDITATAGMIFLVIIFTLGDSEVGVYAFQRLVDTLGGVIVAITVNGIFPIKDKKIL